MSANFIQWLMSQSWSWWLSFLKEWGSAVKDFGTPLGTFFTASVALTGLWGWKRQMRGNLEQEIARKVLAESTNLKRYMKNSATILTQAFTVSRILVEAKQSQELDQVVQKTNLHNESKTSANLEKLKYHLVLFEQVVVEGAALWGNDFELLANDFNSYAENFVNVIDSTHNHVTLIRFISEHFGDKSDLYGVVADSALKVQAPEGNLDDKVQAIHKYVGKKLAKKNSRNQDAWF